MARPHHAAEAMRVHGLAYPGAHEAHPWGEVVLKAKGKVFVFLGRASEDALSFSVKLPQSGERWLDQPCAEPTGYGLGKSGWLTFSFDAGNVLPEAELFALLEESYRAVAPKTLVKELDARSGSAQAAEPKPAKKPRTGTPPRRTPRKPRPKS